MFSHRVSALLLGLGAAGLWGASRMDWVVAETADDLAGDRAIAISGGQWSMETTALALVMLAGCVAGLALRRLGRRVVGVISALAAIGASWAGLTMLAGTPDPERARNVLRAAATNETAVNAEGISEWAQVVAVEPNVVGPVLSLLACAVALFASVLLAMRPGVDPAAVNKYERKAAREEKLERELAESPDSGRVLWDALDADIDPSERPSGETSSDKRRLDDR
ncbi:MULTISPECIES: TIGR02234 family membrane protein [unclassified Corynebacterium]|uniref:TIGR02234 family membrane protein n=1 Tax=unclassified Corynebacterium TaxID=2624378 RepID=UPI0003B87229|nr:MULTISPECIES: TIGR02234 family membrane protein [unclassified Corynebacterium]ERS39941.1 hypothetical protein HMPREF1292_01404 [Corynebacterium sp. KPL1995]ERS73411.1 hypothetical protein HMPREF1290_01411 [Corynebacterium sp. KPL1989]